MQNAYSTVDFVCPVSGRVAVDLKRFAQSEFNGRVVSHLYRPQPGASNADAWVAIDSVDEGAQENTFDLWLASGACEKGIGGDQIVFVRASIAGALREWSEK